MPMCLKITFPVQFVASQKFPIFEIFARWDGGHFDGFVILSAQGDGRSEIMA